MAHVERYSLKYLLSNVAVAALVVGAVLTAVAYQFDLSWYGWLIVSAFVTVVVLFAVERLATPVINRMIEGPIANIKDYRLLEIKDMQPTDGRSIRIITLQEVQWANALRRESMVELIRAIEDASDQIVVLRGKGKAFCGGLNLGELYYALRGQQDTIDFLNLFIRAVKAVSNHGKIISIVEGDVAAGGVALACCARFVIAREGVTFRVPGKVPEEQAYHPLARILIPILEARRGLHPRDESDWFGWTITANQSAQDSGELRGLVDHITTNMDVSELIALAKSKLDIVPYAGFFTPKLDQKVRATAADVWNHAPEIKRALTQQYGQRNLDRRRSTIGVAA